MAEAFIHRSWRRQESGSPAVGFLRKDALNDTLDQILRALTRMELRLPSAEVRGMLEAEVETRRALSVARTWAPADNPRLALDHLLAVLEPDELRLLLARGPEGPEIVAMVPAGPVAPLLLASQAADALVRRALVHEAFFARLAALRPDLADQASRVARLWRPKEP